MKKTLTVSLNGMAYSIDEDAYAILETYINALKQKFGKDTDGQDILRDIEERIAELFAEKKGKSESINLSMVNEVIEILGKPEQIEPDNDPTSSNNEPQGAHPPRASRKLYRDPEHSIIAGVAGGLGNYFSTDPIIFRVLFFILLFAHGIGLLIYLVLWFAVTKAVTPKQKMEMKGEPITLSSIEKNIKEEYDEISENIKKIDTAGVSQKAVGMLETILRGLGRVFIIVLKFFVATLGIILIAGAVIILLSMISALFFGGLAFSTIVPELGGFSLIEFFASVFDISSSSWVLVPLTLIVAIPLLTIMYLGVRMIFRFRANDGISGITAAVAWVLSVVAVAVFLFFQAKSFTIRESNREAITLIPSKSKQQPLIIKAVGTIDTISSSTDETLHFKEYAIKISDGRTLIMGKPRLTISQTSEQYPSLILERRSRGGTHSLAHENANKIEYRYALTDSLLTLNPYFALTQGEKWRAQELFIELKIPIGTKIFLDKSLTKILSANQTFSNLWPDEMVGKTWVVGRHELELTE
ncbi:MAG: PspC domain-containing protein [Bacteroidales bacterium]|nr:PspC domain-containing protein [Bacteroidales bacterium]MBN2749282.1 PspC domain-containing protein [Bacteroidales bacterium]